MTRASSSPRAARETRTELFDSRGRRIGIGAEVFRGGEGTVHPVDGDPKTFAKLYHANRPPDSLKQAKLAAMAATCTDALLRVAAWPSATLHDRPNGHMVGFLMPRFDGQRSELHHLYRPGSRKQSFRQADWSFLLHGARNVAAAVATVHAAGHVVGDVNQRNFIVGNDATVKVLDCDSFQIRANGRIYHCLVGVPEFTPPELQGRPLDAIERTANHDAFGLAVLIFQLLFMGRHPFSGRFLGSGEMPIERAIAEGRFAFGRNSRSRQMEPPPHMLTLDALPPRLSAFFNAAFMQPTRPTAEQWSTALDLAKKELKVCASESMHKYYNGLPECVWCALERTAGVYYFIGVTAKQNASFDFARVWADIMNATTLPNEAPPRPTIVANGRPLPIGFASGRRAALAAKVAAIVLCGVVAFTWPTLTVLMGVAIFVTVILPRPGNAERRRRAAAFAEAERLWREAYAAAEASFRDDTLLRKRLELEKARKAYESIDAEKHQELANLAQNARAIQLAAFLDAHLILDSDIPDIGPRRKTTLALSGIESAADVTWQSVGAVHGFGPALQARLMAWRQSIEARFVFDAKRAIPQPDIDAIEYRSRRRKHDLEQQLRTGADEAKRMREYQVLRRGAVAEELIAPATAWAQARADLELVNEALSSGGRQA